MKRSTVEKLMERTLLRIQGRLKHYLPHGRGERRDFPEGTVFIVNGTYSTMGSGKDWHCICHTKPHAVFVENESGAVWWMDIDSFERGMVLVGQARRM